MATEIKTEQQFSDEELTRELNACLDAERRCLARFLGLLIEVDRRRLYARSAFSSLFDFAVRHLHLSEASAGKRIHAARTAQRFPLILELVERGVLHLSGICLLAPYLTEENQRDLLKAACQRSKRQIEQLLAEWYPKPEVKTTLRKLPQKNQPTSPAAKPNPVSSLHAPGHVALPRTAAHKAPAPKIAAHKPATNLHPLAPQRYLLRITASQSLKDKLERAQNLLDSEAPSGELAEIIERGLDLLIAERLKKRFALGAKAHAAAKSKPKFRRTRAIPAEVRRTVYQRDEGRCTYIDDRGQRCPSTRFLEFHHERPYARGGAHTTANVRLLCHLHNAHLAREDFGVAFVENKIAGTKHARLLE